MDTTKLLRLFSRRRSPTSDGGSRSPSAAARPTNSTARYPPFLAATPTAPSIWRTGKIEIGELRLQTLRKPMGAGRKNLKREVEEESIAFDEGQTVMQVVSLRGSNIIEVMDAKGEKSLAFFPAKFQKSMWVKRGSFVVIDESGREEAEKSGSRVACIVRRVLFYEQVRQLQKSLEWPEAFKSGESSSKSVEEVASQQGDDGNSSDDELPPLEANTNRTMPFEMHVCSESDSDTGS